jgi:hypothetical protein
MANSLQAIDCTSISINGVPITSGGGGGVTNVVQALSGAGSLLATTDVLEVDSTSAGFTVTLLEFADVVRPVYIDSVGTGGNLVILDPPGLETINGASSISIASGELWLLYKGSSEQRARKIA